MHGPFYKTSKTLPDKLIEKNLPKWAHMIPPDTALTVYGLQIACQTSYNVAISIAAWNYNLLDYIQKSM